MRRGDAVDAVDDEDRKRWREDPIWFVQNRLGATPWGKQRDILRALREHDYVAVRSCNGSGKTYIAAHAVIWWLMCYDDAVVVTTAPTERQVSQLLWREIRGIHAQNEELIGGRISSTRLELGPRRFAFGFSTNVTERFQGFHQGHILFVVDEASGVAPGIFDAIEGSMTSRHAKMLLIGNPTSLSGVFYDAFHKDRALWHTIHISAFDTPGLSGDVESADGLITPEWVERAAQRWGKQSATYQVRVLGDFPATATDTLIPLTHIEAAVGRRLLDTKDHETVMGLDVARFGDDRTVACLRRGPTVIGLWVFPSSDIMATTGRALDLARQHSVDTINVDEVGLGAGLLDRMHEIGEFETVGINGGRRASDSERYANLRAEMFDGLRQRFQDGDISIVDDAELISELASLKYSFTSKGQIRLEDKQALRSSGRPSPDKADALMLAFARNEDNPLMMWI